MARSRNIKPGFFKNEALAELSPLTRLLFAGLWTLSDRDGRLEDRPKRIRAEVLPYDDGSVDEMLNELHSAGFIQRYQTDDQRFIQVVNFARHQNPHCREPASTIPAPGEHRASTVHAPGEHGTGPADSLNLIPDSLNPSTAPSSVDDGGAQATPEHRIPDCPHQQIIELYHQALPTGTRVRVWSGARVKHLQARWREDTKRQNVEWWQRFFAYCAQSEFLTGQTQPANGRDPFVVSLDWLVSPQNFAKCIEGKYHRSTA
ncbi:hypothetical protein [Methyloversatilis universalis]|uniref:hypothetical protein n=1 Tax=Methyloversatilis universalis TaxID=378211 RepID=UPI00035C9692|nr:hypothetical protein [Methyloversatilis universalis]